MLVLRTCNEDMTGHNGFKWPEAGPVEAPDWKPTYECGNGLHGLPWGVGGSEYLNWGDDAKWLVVEAADGDVLTGQGDLTDKCKFPKGNVVFCGDRGGAVEYMMARGADGSKMVLGLATASGYMGTATASGYMGTATASGYRGTATASGDGGTATASGDRGTATASGDRGTATASGYRGTATASGYRGTATASGYGGTATAGDMGSIFIQWWDAKSNRWRITTGYVGEDGIEANVPYRCDDNGKLVKVEGGDK